MTADLKAAVRARVEKTGEKYTQARRAVLASRSAHEPEEVTIRTARNGLPLAEQDCSAMTKRGRRCRNPFIDGQFWPGGLREVTLEDGPATRMLAQRRCHVHVDHSIHARVTLLMDDLPPAPSSSFAWQDQHSLQAIRNAATGPTRANALGVYLVLTETKRAADASAGRAWVGGGRHARRLIS